MPIFADSPQSIVPVYTPRVPVTLDDDIEASQVMPQPPKIITAAQNVAVDAYNVITDPKSPRARKIFIQNQGAAGNIIYYAYNQTATAAVYHGTILPGTNADDGLGDKVEFKIEEHNIQRISLLGNGANGVKASTEIFTYLT